MSSPNSFSITFNDVKIGKTEHIERYITEFDVALFSALSWDHNPLHVNPGFAKQSYFRDRIVHGAFIVSQISSLIANKLPGPGSILLKLDLKFRAPLRIGDTLTVFGKVIDKNSSNRRITIEVKCLNQNQRTLVEGNAVVMLISDLESKAK